MNTIRIKKQAKFFTICTLAAITGFLIYMLSYTLSVDLSQLTAASFLLSCPAAVFAVLSITHALILLRTVVKSESPFIAKNIRHLQWIGWLFVAYEPVFYICQAISNRYFPVSLGNGSSMTTTSAYGGIFLVCGFVILTVATIFRYGMELQQLSDETL